MLNNISQLFYIALERNNNHLKILMIASSKLTSEFITGFSKFNISCSLDVFDIKIAFLSLNKFKSSLSGIN